ncbi:MAG: polysaccharide pyruvyl transferase family protein [Ruminococcaceae bacterium]|nr:polysaccharide pyruvyl transferase family protein [Oscillospiraceae bacterium]
MKKVYLYAYDRQNLGDDLFVHTITKRYPDVQFYIWTGVENKAVFKCLPNLKVIDKDSKWVRFLQKLRPSLVYRYRYALEDKCHAVVYIGGSIFYEYETWDIVSNWWLYMAENRPMYAIGCNFGPWRTEAYRAKMARIYAKMKDVCFRDKYSAELFNDVPTVRQAPDILFNYPMPQCAVDEKNVFVSLIDCASRDDSLGLSALDESYISGMAKLLGEYLDKGHTLALASFCRHEGDEKAIAKIRQAMGIAPDDDRVTNLCYDGTNANQMLAAISSASFVIATRFHATILALAAGRPVLPIIYSDKTAHVLEDLGYAGRSVDLRKENWVSYLESEENRKVTSQLDTIKEQAQKHFAVLEQLIK